MQIDSIPDVFDAKRKQVVILRKLQQATLCQFNKVSGSYNKGLPLQISQETQGCRRFFKGFALALRSRCAALARAHP